MCLSSAVRFGNDLSGVAYVRSLRTILSLGIVLLAVRPALAEEDQAKKAQEEVAQAAAAAKELAIRMIGATALVTEVSTGIPLPARVDTGATCCSIHCEKFEIKDADPNPKVNIGKPVRFFVPSFSGDGKGEWVESKIIDHVTVRTSEREDKRYKVQLKLRVDDVEKKVAVTLNDREKMKYPVLLGRNFLRDDFLVNVALDAD